MSTTVIIQPDYKLLVEMLGDEGTLQLRQGIVETFAERHLRAVANSEAMKERLDELKRQLSNEFSAMVAEKIGKVKSGYSGGGIALIDDFDKAIRARVIQLAEQYLGDNLRDIVQERYTDLYNHMVIEVDRRLGERLDSAMEAHIKREVERRLAAVVAQVSNG